MLGRRLSYNLENGGYYHVDTHCCDENRTYLDESDYCYFLSLLEEFILKHNFIEILCYSLEPNHISLLFYQTDKSGVEKLLNSVTKAYNLYFYKRYGIRDILPYKGYVINKVLNKDILDTSRNIHLLPDTWIDCPYSSIRAYFYDDVPKWLNKTHIADLYGSAVGYSQFLKAD